MRLFLNNRVQWLLLGILLLATGLIFYNLAAADVQTDEATYAFRSIGYLDHMDSTLQTTPIQWFGVVPWWSKLSFHDAPPLVFLIQHLFFILFGVSVFTLRLPFALAGLGSIFLTYLVGKKLHSESVGLVSAFSLTVFSYHIWASRVGYLEMVALFFVLLTIYFFLISLEDKKWLLVFGIALGFTLLTKYTVLFTVFALVLYLIFAQRQMFKDKRFWLALIFAAVIFSPVVFYNIQLYETRGHFDVQFAKLFGQDISKDWPVFGGESFSANPVKNGSQIVKTLASSFSLPLFVIILVAVSYVAVLSIKRRGKHVLIALMIFCAVIQFIFVPPAARFLSLFNPFLALALAWAVYDLLIQVKIYSNFRWVVISGLVVFALFELTFNINTNLLTQPYGQADINYSHNRVESGGFNELEAYLVDEMNLDFKAKKIKTGDELKISPTDFSHADVVLYDSGLRWFSTLWYFGRWTTYTDTLFLPSREIVAAVQDGTIFQFFQQAGVERVFLVKGNLDSLVESGGYRFNDQGLNDSLRDELIKLGAQQKAIYNKKGQEAFVVYSSNVAEWPNLLDQE